MKLSYDDVARLALGAGFRANDDSAATAVAIAKAESGFNSGIYGDAAVGGSVGLWQIHLPSNPQYDANSLRDPQTNARAAYSLYRQRGFNPWCTYKPSACGGAGNNAYAQHLNEARAAVARVSGESTSWIKSHPWLVASALLLTAGAAAYYFKPQMFPSARRLLAR